MFKTCLPLKYYGMAFRFSGNTGHPECALHLRRIVEPFSDHDVQTEKEFL